MSFDDVWSDLQSACTSVRDDVTLLTPASRRRFVIQAVEEDGIVVEFPDEGSEQVLRRDQFEMLVDRLGSATAGLSVDALSPHVEPYATVLTLADRYAVDEDVDVLSATLDGPDENPLVRSGRAEPPVPEQAHDDLVLLADLLERLDVGAPESLSTEELADLYVLLSEVEWDADEFRRLVSEELLDRIGPGGRIHGRFGTVSRTVRERRRPKPDGEVYEVLDDAGIPREWVTGVDPEKLDVVLAVTDVEEADVYDVTEQVYMQKTGVETAEKRSRLQGIKDRLEDADAAEADELLDEVEAIERRLDDVLAAG